MRFVPIIILLCFCVLSVFGQDTLRVDSVRAPLDTARVDSVISPIDTTAEVSGIDTVITYSSTDSIVYSFPTKTMSLYSKGDIRYEDMELKSERIDVNWDSSTLTAFGVPDTADTAKGKIRGAPIMKDGGEEYHGQELGYNFETKKGRIRVADTEVDKGYYHGERIKKVEEKTLFVADGRYTTCDLPEPHYYFASPKMKVTLQDKVIAEPVYLYIADVPVFWLPLAVFPNKGGRRSGLIAPAIAEDARRGRLLRHIGYYWAMNDYMDWSARTDLYTKGSWALYSDYRYALRYSFSGSLSGNFKKFIEGEPSDPGRNVEESYWLNLRHNQEIDPTMRLDADFTFASSNSFRNTIDLRDALRQSIVSNATLSKRWEGTPNSMSVNVSRRQNLIDGSIDETLPSLNFTHSQSFPFRFGKKTADPSKLAWYEMIGVSYSANASNRRAKVKTSVDSIKVNVDGIDTLQTVEDFAFNRTRSLTQNVSLNIAPKLGYFTIAPSMSYRDERSFFDNDVPTRSSTDSTLTVSNTKETQRAGYFSSGVTASTKLYGIVQPGLLGVAALRHAMTPSLSFTYSKQVIGDNIGPKQMLMSLNVGNIFEMKTIPPEPDQEGTKIQLMNVGVGVSYNFSADSLNLSPIGVSYRTGIENVVDIGGGMTFDLYKQDPVSFRRINTFLINDGRLARMTDFRVSISTSLAGEKKQSKTTTEPEDTLARQQPASGYYGVFRDEEPDFSIPWRLSLAWNYSENKVQPNPSRSSSLTGSLEFNLTENWKFSMRANYDITNREILYPSINVTRDLHCWVMNFSWVPIGTIRSYQFEIRLKAPQLQDIKVTKQGSERGIY